MGQNIWVHFSEGARIDSLLYGVHINSVAHTAYIESLPRGKAAYWNLCNRKLKMLRYLFPHLLYAFMPWWIVTGEILPLQFNIIKLIHRFLLYSDWTSFHWASPHVSTFERPLMDNINMVILQICDIGITLGANIWIYWGFLWW